jgi:hypothetical protein
LNSKIKDFDQNFWQFTVWDNQQRVCLLRDENLKVTCVIVVELLSALLCRCAHFFWLKSVNSLAFCCCTHEKTQQPEQHDASRSLARIAAHVHIVVGLGLWRAYFSIVLFSRNRISRSAAAAAAV